MPGMESVLIAVLPLLGTAFAFMLKLLPLLSDRVNKRAVRLARAKRAQS